MHFQKLENRKNEKKSEKRFRKIACFLGVFSFKKSLIHLFFKYFHLAKQEKLFFFSYIGKKFRDFPRKNNPNTVKLTLTLVKITPS